LVGLHNTHLQQKKGNWLTAKQNYGQQVVYF